MLTKKNFLVLSILFCSFVMSLFINMNSANAGSIYNDENLQISDSSEQEASQPVRARELSESEYHESIKEFYDRHSDSITIIDFEDEGGIDLNQIPSEFRPAIEPGVKVVAIKIMMHPEYLEKNLNKDVCDQSANLASSGCPIYFGTRDVTLSRKEGGIEQYARVLGDIYEDNSHVCGRRCYGYRIHKQYAWWVRDHTGWTVTNARLRTTYNGDIICVGGSSSASRVSAAFTPTWQSSNMSHTYIMDGFTNNIIIPFPTGVSRTEGDFREGGQTKHSNVHTNILWRNENPG